VLITALAIILYALAVWFILSPALFIQPPRWSGMRSQDDRYLLLYIGAPLLLPLLTLSGGLGLLLAFAALLVLAAGVVLAVPVLLVLNALVVLFDAWVAFVENLMIAGDVFVSMLSTVLSPPGKKISGSSVRSKSRR
jgi:hypothetical protein